MQYLRIKNYEQYQHYKDRNPPWIKLYRCMMNDYELRGVPVTSRLAYVYLLIVASETDNRIPNDHKFLSDRFGFEVNELTLNPLIDSGFLLASGARRLLACHATSSSLLSSSEESPLNHDLNSLNSPDLKSLKSLKTKSKDHASKSSAPWIAYSQAFRNRYGVDPVRNAKINGMLCKLVDRLGAEEAPLVAASYCENTNAFYLGGKHCVDLLLRDCEGLRMEWATGRQMTRTMATQHDQTSTTGHIIKKLIAEEEAKHVHRTT